MVDAHTWWRMGDNSYTRRDGRADWPSDLAAYDIAWLEEPLPPDDHEAYRAAQGKRLRAPRQRRARAERRALPRSDPLEQRRLRADGRLLPGRLHHGPPHLLPEIAREGLSFAFHSWGTALEVMAAAHLGICWPETVVEWLEYPVYTSFGVQSMYPFPLAAEILKEPLPIERGDLIVPREPGLGVQVDESVIERYPWIPGPWSFFRLDSPAETWAVTGDHSVKWSAPG